MNSSGVYQKLIEEYVSNVSLHLEGVPPQESLEMLDEVREVLHAKLLEDVTGSFDPVEVLDEPSAYASRLLDAAGYLTPAPYIARKSPNRKRNAVYAVLLFLILLAIPFRVVPSLSNAVSNILNRVPIFGFFLLFLYVFLITIFLVRALGGSVTGWLNALTFQFKKQIDRLPLGSGFLKFLEQLRPVWWFLRAWTLAILISYQSDSILEKHFYPVPSMQGHRSIGLLLFAFLVVGSFAVGKHAITVKQNTWFIPLVIINVTLAFMFSAILFSQADFNNLKHEQRVDASFEPTLGTQIGASCTKENEAINKPGSGGGTLFCLKTPQGLFWNDFDTVTGNTYLNTVLPSCNTRVYSKSTLTPEMTQLAENYFRDRNLLPVKVTMWGEANRELFAEGIRPCSNGIGVSLGAYSGFIPKEASAGWAILIVHKTDQFGDTNFLRIVKIGDTYKVIDVGTSP